MNRPTSAISGILGSARYAVARLAKKLRPSSLKNTRLGPDSAIGSGSQAVDVSMGRHSFCGYDCTLINVEIGAFCSIADRVCIGGAGHPIDFVSTSPVFLSHRDSVRAKFARHDFSNLPRTTIGHDVWIGFGAVVKSGVTIGTGAVVGMGAVVTRDVAPYSIVAGNPAREIRKRFSPEVCESLLVSEWWNYDEDTLYRVGGLFNDVKKFIGFKSG